MGAKISISVSELPMDEEREKLKELLQKHGDRITVVGGGAVLIVGLLRPLLSTPFFSNYGEPSSSPPWSSGGSEWLSWPPLVQPSVVPLFEKHSARRPSVRHRFGCFAQYDSAHYQRSGR